MRQIRERVESGSEMSEAVLVATDMVRVEGWRGCSDWVQCYTARLVCPKGGRIGLR